MSVPNYSSFTTTYNTAKTALETLQTEIQGIPTQVTQLAAVRDAALTEANRLQAEYAQKVTPSKIHAGVINACGLSRIASENASIAATRVLIADKIEVQASTISTYWTA